ncbi:MAG: PDZ domain-containing protein [Anaerolineae bacterium]|nr:PDZ domain-containing protein [Anaerolineae bacterium]
MQRLRLKLILVMVVLVVSTVGLSTLGAQDRLPAGPLLGIQVEPADEGVSVVIVIPGSPADEAGLLSKDIILSVNGEAVTADSIREVISALEVGDEVALEVQRGEETLTLSATLGDVGIIGHGGSFSSAIGFDGLMLTERDNQVVVESVADESRAAEAGLEDGDVITSANGTAITNLRELMEAVAGTEAGEPVSLEVQRGDETLTLEVELPAMPMLPDMTGMIPAMPFEEGTLPGFMMESSGYLGVEFETQDDGALIKNVVPDSPAAAAGILADDRITAVNGEPVDAERTLRDRIRMYEPEDVITLTVVRGDDTQELEVTLSQVSNSMMWGMVPGELNVMPGAIWMGPEGWVMPHMGQQGFMMPQGPHIFIMPGSAGGWAVPPAVEVLPVPESGNSL